MKLTAFLQTILEKIGLSKCPYPASYDRYGPRSPPSDKIIQLAERIAALSPERLAMIGPNLLQKVKPPVTRPIESEGADLGAAKVEEEKTEETALDVNLGKFDAPSNINIVEEVHLDKIIQLAERMAALSPEELALIGPFLRDKLYPPQPPTVEEKKAEKTTYDVKLEKFDAASKIKVIKEVRAFTSLGLKEAKELVEKAPVITKQGVTKEEAVGIIQKLRAVGGIAVME